MSQGSHSRYFRPTPIFQKSKQFGGFFSCDQKLTSVDQLGLVTPLQVVEDGGVVEVGQVDHVVAFLKLWRVDLANLSRWESFFLKKNIKHKLPEHFIQLKSKNEMQLHVYPEPRVDNLYINKIKIRSFMKAIAY